MYERDEMVKCTSCRGRGYHRCACWPGDCICGEDDRDCEECDGSGWTWPDEDIDTLIERARAMADKTPHEKMATRHPARSRQDDVQVRRVWDFQNGDHKRWVTKNN